ncbi:MAG: hypothetical protein JNJ46_20975 [Myxococcales bacterium]|nr:hypothetical protein [Myxococcales bacterium]
MNRPRHQAHPVEHLGRCAEAQQRQQNRIDDVLHALGLLSRVMAVLPTVCTDCEGGVCVLQTLRGPRLAGTDPPIRLRRTLCDPP